MTSTSAPAPAAADVTRLMQDLERNRVLPPGGGDVLASVNLAGDPALPEVAASLLGSLRLDLDARLDAPRALLGERLVGCLAGALTRGDRHHDVHEELFAV